MRRPHREIIALSVTMSGILVMVTYWPSGQGIRMWPLERMPAERQERTQTRIMVTIRSPHLMFNSPLTRRMDVRERIKLLLSFWITSRLLLPVDIVRTLKPAAIHGLWQQQVQVQAGSTVHLLET